MFNKSIFTALALIPLVATAQFNVAVNGGYTFHTGPHHSDYENTMATGATDYNNKKVFTYSSSLKLGYAFKHLHAGIGFDYGNYQTKKETEITGLSSFVPSSSFAAATGRYFTPHVFINYKTNLTRKLNFQIGVMTGILFSGFGKDNGILVTNTDAIFGIIPAQTIGVEMHSGGVDKTTSSNIASGAQMEFGYDLNKNFNLNFEVAARYSSIKAKASVLGYEQPFEYKLWYIPARIGVRYTFHRKVKDDEDDE